MDTIKFTKIDNSEIVAVVGEKVSQEIGTRLSLSHQSRGAKSTGIHGNEIYLVNQMGAIQYAFRNGKIIVMFEPWISDDKKSAVIDDFSRIDIAVEIEEK